MTSHVEGLKISTDKSTPFRKLKVRIITDAPGYVDVCIVDVELPSIFGGEANVTPFCLVRRANHVDFAFDTFKYPSINDITREDHDLV